MFKTLIRPRNRVGNFMGNVESIFDNFFDSYPESAVTFQPRWDIDELQDSYRITLELPGVKPDDVNVEVEDGVLTISGQKTIDRTDENTNYHRAERLSGEFKRTLEFSTPVELDKIEAVFENGLLVVNVPKSEKAMPRKIEVKTK